ncbi:hypothetical protein K439DRAFT_1629555 [Ramaria rubella]|nr:hypothetical protein K439DRAFT_1629555 [Ramaria rubella]
MAPYDELFNRLNAGVETRELTRSLYSKASQLTAHGSGHSLGQGHNVLFAICAFLASLRLGNSEITKDQARTAACVDRKAFDTTLSIVEGLLPGPSSSRVNQSSTTYRSLLKQYDIPREDAHVPMMEVEYALKGCKALVEGNPIETDSSLMQSVIFFWVCTGILKVPTPDAKYLRQSLHVSPKKWSASLRALEKHCGGMTGDLIQRAEIALAARDRRPLTRAITKKGETLLTKSPRHGEPLIPITPSKALGVKRKTSVAETQGNESPLKRSKSSHYVPSGLGQDLATHTPKSKRGNAASPVAPLRPFVQDQDVDGNESDEPPTEETIIVRSVRTPQKRPDRSAWEAQRPAPATTAELGTTPLVISTQDNALVDVFSLNSTPMTSIGLSETPSPDSPSSPNAQTRTRLPLTGKIYYFPNPEEEEMPRRRRRRNLRAAFLDPGAYGWKPSKCLTHKLERAHNWEKLMIEKYGDPWDKW